MSPFSASDKHRECWDLLPWLANERLSPNDLQRIEPHLQACAACQAELALQRRLRDAIRTDDAVVIAPQASFQKLMQRIDDEEAASESSDPNETQQTDKLRWLRRPHWLAIAASVQAVAIAVLLATMWSQSQALLTAPRFSTLTTPSSVPRGPVIRVVFREQITIAELNELVRSIEAHIVAGPNSAGVYTLQLTGGEQTSERVEKIAAQLRKDERILFSEPAVAEITSR
jgi:hypothetical protein